MTTTGPRREPPALPPELDPRAPRRQPDRHRPPPRRHRWLARLAVAVSALVLVVSAGGYAAFRFYDAQLTRIGIRLPGHALPVDTDGSAQNFVIAGSDTRNFAGGGSFQAAPGSADYVTGQRSDTVMLVHIPAGSGKPTVVSFPRDSYVQIPAYTDARGLHHDPYMAKLNEAFAVGGPALLVQLIENLSGLKVDHYVQVDFAGFRSMVDALGGVTLCVGTTRHDHDSGDMLTAGTHRDVNGDVALAFVRDRKGLPNGDIDRIRDQQYFLAQVMHKVLSAGTLGNPFKLNAFLSAAARDVTVDARFGIAQMRTLATRLRHLDPSHVTFETVPISTEDGTATIHGLSQSVVLLDAPRVTAMFSALRGPASAAPTDRARRLPPAQVTLRVLNGTRTAGLAARAAAALRAAGFSVTAVGNTVPVAVTTVRYPPGQAGAAATVAAYTAGARTEAATAETTVTLVLGPDFTGVRTPTRAPSRPPPAHATARPTSTGPACAP